MRIKARLNKTNISLISYWRCFTFASSSFWWFIFHMFNIYAAAAAAALLIESLKHPDKCQRTNSLRYKSNGHGNLNSNNNKNIRLLRRKIQPAETGPFCLLFEINISWTNTQKGSNTRRHTHARTQQKENKTKYKYHWGDIRIFKHNLTDELCFVMNHIFSLHRIHPLTHHTLFLSRSIFLFILFGIKWYNHNVYCAFFISC